MIYLPSSSRTITTNLRHAAVAAAVAAGLLGAATVTLDLVGITRPVTGGYAATAIGALAAVALKSGACIRRMVATAITAVIAEQAAERETLRQLVAEVGRLRALLRDCDDLLAEHDRMLGTIATAVQGLADAETVAAAQRIHLRLLNG